MKAILVNGPPRSGKDTASDHIESRYNAEHLKFATPIYQSVPRLFNIPFEKWAALYIEEKEELQPELMGMSPREAMIWLSESVMKPHFGSDVFGHMFTNALPYHSPESLIVVSDSGFQPEAEVLMKEIGVENMLLLRIHRPGCDFRNDSRNYVFLDCESHDIDNDGSLDDFYKRVGELVQPFVGEQYYANTA